MRQLSGKKAPRRAAAPSVKASRPYFQERMKRICSCSIALEPADNILQILLFICHSLAQLMAVHDQGPRTQKKSLERLFDTNRLLLNQVFTQEIGILPDSLFVAVGLHNASFSLHLFTFLPGIEEPGSRPSANDRFFDLRIKTQATNTHILHFETTLL